MNLVRICSFPRGLSRIFRHFQHFFYPRYARAEKNVENVSNVEKISTNHLEKNKSLPNFIVARS